MAHGPHQNFVDSNAMNEDNYRFHWHLEFINDLDLIGGALVCKSELSSQLPDTLHLQIRYHSKIAAFRALGRVLGTSRQGYVLLEEYQPWLNFSECAQWDTQGVMVDCSRNGVLLLSKVYFLLNTMALMGLNMLQLYTEDTFEVVDEPLFGYLRGKYTLRELSLIDDYAADLGIEVMPCIQTLGHMGQLLQRQHYAHLRDNSEVLLAESEETYEFIEKLIQSVSSPFRSKRIHIGMDEAHGVGEGRYRQLFGYKDPKLIFIEHLQRVSEICARNNLQPMIWSDMLFCLAINTNSLLGYYDEANHPVFQGVDTIPANLELVFWDYYHTNPGVYSEKIRQHKQMGCQKPWVAAGIWTWSRFWAAIPFSLKSIRASMVAAKNTEEGVRHTLVTIWGDEGNECDMFSSLPALLYYAQHGYCEQEEVDMSLLKTNFEGICGATFDAWVLASKIDDIPEGIPITDKSTFSPNISKWLLWEDPLLGFLSPQYTDQDLESHYRSIERELSYVLEQSQGSSPLNERLELPLRIAKTLALKCSVRQHCVNAYKQKDHQRLLELAHGHLTLLRAEVDSLWKYHRYMWSKTYKAFGWEVIESRYGGLRSRLETMFDKIIDHVHYMTTLHDTAIYQDEEEDQDERMHIPEFETSLECLYSGLKTNILLEHKNAAFVSRLG
ncbi:glycoside hydrolase superfamily [Sporodiniella umbellata]|nr:glycoside hydrolase superfamily [Sporodiniella umbellata]